MRSFLTIGTLSCLGLCLPAVATVVSVATNGCTVRQTVHLAASPQQVYDALIEPAKWWSPEHTFSNDSTNLTLDARAGGCFCEKLPGGGSAEHMTVVFASPGKALTLRGALGPFQGQAVEGALSWVLTPAGTQTDLTMTFTLGGYLTLAGGFEKWATLADTVFTVQVARLQKFVNASKS
jgi:uncharacterized protein YndB with AHSA1/START domain